MPPHQVTQQEACEFFERVMDADPRLDSWRETSKSLAHRIYSRTGISTRHTVLPDFLQTNPADFQFFPRRSDLEPLPTTAQRMTVFERESVDLAEAAARHALAQANVHPSQITHLVISTCTGFFSPGPDVLLARRLSLSPSVSRTILGFMGCYAGISGIRTADQILRGDPGAVVLQIAVELCSLHFSKDFSADALVAGALFADGAAAAVYAGAEWEGGCGQKALGQVQTTASFVSENSMDRMSWRIGDHGFEMRLSSSVPDILRSEAPAFVEELARSANIAPHEITRWAIHPGGRRIVEVLRECLQLTPEQVASSFEILRDYGNMSSATVLFVLDRELSRTDPPPGHVGALAFGPGLTVEGVLLAPTG